MKERAARRGDKVASTYVALLRGINVGTAKRVAMVELRALVEELGYHQVRTLLNSGNLVFTCTSGGAREAALRIEKALEVKLGVSARVTVITKEEIDEIVAGNPLGKIADNPSRLLVGILADPADRKKIAEIAPLDWGKEKIELGWAGKGAKGTGAKGPAPKGSGEKGSGGAARALYMWVPQGVIESKLNAAVSKALGDGVTARNWSTILKLKEMTEEPDAARDTPLTGRPRGA
jgi:uncharacterized protein (DUF1697 family)